MKFVHTIPENGHEDELLNIIPDTVDHAEKFEVRVACRRALDFAQIRPELLQRVENTGKLPMNELVEGTVVECKTLERHRKYLAAFLLAFYQQLRDHPGPSVPDSSKERRRPSVKYDSIAIVE